MTTARCPACGASVAPRAPWCTLCYVDLRPAPAPEPAVAESADVPQPVSVGARGEDLAVVTPPPPPDPHLDAPISKASDIRLSAPGWPCRHCSTLVPMSEDNCPKCHTTFLIPEDFVEVTLPGVGNVRRLDTKMRTILGLVGALGLTLLLVLLAFIVGWLF